MPHDRCSQRRRPFRPAAESLEARAVLTAGAGAVFADIPATIGTAGTTAAIPFTIDPAHFKAPRGKLTLGLDVSGEGTTAATPAITSVLDAKGHALAIRHTTYPAAVGKLLGGKTVSSAVTVNLNVAALRRGNSAAFTAVVASQGQTTGGLRVGFYLPGDADGDGVVTAADIKTIRADQKLQIGDPKYSLDADANRDGQIDKADLAIARSNLGASTTVSPTLTGAPDPISAVNTKTLTTSTQDLGFAGAATPGAKITATAITGGAPTATTTAGADGKYRLVLHLAQGPNAFTITSADAFGQLNTGVLPSIIYVPST